MFSKYSLFSMGDRVAVFSFTIDLMAALELKTINSSKRYSSLFDYEILLDDRIPERIEAGHFVAYSPASFRDGIRKDSINMRICYKHGFFDIRGLSSEVKPVVGTLLKSQGAINEATFRKEVTQGDEFLEIDTGDKYINDGSEWVKQ